MKRSGAGWASMIAAALLPVPALLISAAGHRAVCASETAVTYNRQIAPILYRSCASCHHAGGSGPFSLMSYADARRWGTSVKTVVESRYMPPWLPEPGHGEFAGNRRLADADIALIRRWVDSGMAEGDRSDAPAPPVFARDWQLGPPDLVLEVDSPMQVPASGPDIFRNFILPFPLAQAKWVRAMEIKPGSPQVVHHANLILDPARTLRRTHPQDWTNGVPGMDVVVDAGEHFDPDGHFLDWKPDASALVEAPGTPWRLEAGSDLILNMHLKPTGKIESVRARIGLYFTTEPATKQPILVQLEHDAALKIPQGDADFIVEDKLKLPVAVDVLAIYPHAHYLGKRLEGWAELPGGKRESLILIRNWDIDRQSIYRFAKPVFLPAESVLHMRYSYDNSAENPHNPNSPPILVTGGNRSTDEMGHLWLQLLPRPQPGQKGDLREPLLRAWMENILSKNPNDATALFNLASADMSEAKFAKATALYERALAARPHDARMLTALASALDKLGEWRKAAQRLSEAIESDPTYLDAHFNLANIEFRHEELNEAQREFSAALQLNGEDGESHAGLGAVLAALGQPAEARVHLQRAVELGSGSADVLFALAALDAASGDRESAAVHLRQSIALRPQNADAHRGLAALDAAAGDLPGAIAEERAVLKLEASRPDDWNDLGVMLARSGDREAARGAFEKALSLDATNQTARANLARLQGAVR